MRAGHGANLKDIAEAQHPEGAGEVLLADGFSELFRQTRHQQCHHLVAITDGADHLIEAALIGDSALGTDTYAGSAGGTSSGIDGRTASGIQLDSVVGTGGETGSGVLSLSALVTHGAQHTDHGSCRIIRLFQRGLVSQGIEIPARFHAQRCGAQLGSVIQVREDIFLCVVAARHGNDPIGQPFECLFVHSLVC